MSTLAVGAWSLHLGTVSQTAVRGRTGDVDPTAPWPHVLALAALDRLGARRSDRPRSLGAGRGVPVMASQRVRLHGVDLEVEWCATTAGGEVSLVGPPGDELCGDGAVDEATWWDAVDAVCDAAGVRQAVICDEEAPLPGGDVAALLGRHLGVLVPEWSVPDPCTGASALCVLPRSGLSVLVR